MSGGVEVLNGIKEHTATHCTVPYSAESWCVLLNAIQDFLSTGQRLEINLERDQGARTKIQQSTVQYSITTAKPCRVQHKSITADHKAEEVRTPQHREAKHSPVQHNHHSQPHSTVQHSIISTVTRIAHGYEGKITKVDRKVTSCILETWSAALNLTSQMPGGSKMPPRDSTSAYISITWQNDKQIYKVNKNVRKTLKKTTTR